MVYKQFTKGIEENDLLDEDEFQQILSEAANAAREVANEVESGELPILSLSKDTNDLQEIHDFADDIKARFDKLVVLGTGGSSLCGQALVTFMQRSTAETEVVFIPNIDPVTWDDFLDNIDVEKTAFLVISKSGGTIETLVSFVACLGIKNDPSSNFFVITEDQPSPLRDLAKENNIKIFNHDPDVGGRFAIFSLVGLMPGAVSGINIEEFKQGGAEFLDNHIDMAAYSAALHVAFMRKNIWQNVLMTYPDRLDTLNKWYRQIWAESTGKNGTGSTPIKSTGTFDQHSQMQLYLGGRKDKFYNFVTLDMAGQGVKLQNSGIEDISYLNGKTLGDVIFAEQQSAIDTIASTGRPVRVIEMQNLDSINIGRLAMHLMLETIITAKVLGVNPYDQPAVEDGKKLTRSLLSRSSNMSAS